MPRMTSAAWQSAAKRRLRSITRAFSSGVQISVRAAGLAIARSDARVGST